MFATRKPSAPNERLLNAAHRTITSDMKSYVESCSRLPTVENLKAAYEKLLTDIKAFLAIYKETLSLDIKRASNLHELIIKAKGQHQPKTAKLKEMVKKLLQSYAQSTFDGNFEQFLLECFFRTIEKAFPEHLKSNKEEAKTTKALK